MALAEIDQDDGVPVNVVSKKLHVDPSFVTTQSKLLEKKGFIRRKTSTEDARIVQMSLTDKTYKQLASLASQQEALNEFISRRSTTANWPNSPISSPPPEPPREGQPESWSWTSELNSRFLVPAKAGTPSVSAIALIATPRRLF